MDRLGSAALNCTYALCLHHPKKVMGLWILSALSCAYWALDLTNYCVFSYTPPSGTPSADAFNQISTYFPQFLFQDFEIIVLQTKHNAHVINNDTEYLLSVINDTLWNEINPQYNILVEYTSFYDASNQIPVSSPLYPLYKNRFVSGDNKTMISLLNLKINGIQQNTINGFIVKLQDKLTQFHGEYSQYRYLSVTGPMTMWQQGMTELQSDMTTKDMLMMPFIFALILYVVGSWKFVLVIGPILGMVMVLSMSSFLPFAKYNVWKTNPMAPSIMLFLAMALSVDYSMFLVSRFSAEINKGSSVQNAVREMIKYSAHVVVLSGTVLFISYIGVTFFPVAGTLML